MENAGNLHNAGFASRLDKAGSRFHERQATGGAPDDGPFFFLNASAWHRTDRVPIGSALWVWNGNIGANFWWRGVSVWRYAAVLGIEGWRKRRDFGEYEGWVGVESA